VTTAELRPFTGGPSWLVIQLLERCNLQRHMCYGRGDSGAYKSASGLINILHGERAAEVRSHLRVELISLCTACTRYYPRSAHPIGRTTARRRTDS
jgi:hypothetical protein